MLFLISLSWWSVFATSNIHTCGPLLIPIRVEPGRVTLDGADIDPYHHRPLHVRGRNNSGLLRSTFRGQPVLLKRLDGGARTEAVRSASGELIGGPRIFGVASLEHDGKAPLQYLVMEEFFAGQTSFTFQGLIETSAHERSRGIQTMTEGPPDRRLTRQLADWLVRGLVHDVLPPVDLDFIMTKNELRLIDVGSISVGRLARHENPDRFFVHAILRLVARSLEIHLDKSVADIFRGDVLAALRALLNDEDRFARLERTADEVYDDNGQFIDILKGYLPTGPSAN